MKHRTVRVSLLATLATYTFPPIPRLPPCPVDRWLGRDGAREEWIIELPTMLRPLHVAAVVFERATPVARFSNLAALTAAAEGRHPFRQRPVRWWRRLTADVRAQALMETMWDCDRVAELDHLDWMRRSDDVDAMVAFLHDVDDIVCVGRLLVAAGRDENERNHGRRMVEQMEELGGRVITTVVVGRGDARLRTVAWQEPDAWWSGASDEILTRLD